MAGVTKRYDLAVEELRASSRFVHWEKSQSAEAGPSSAGGEKFWTPQELAKEWEVSAETVRIVFRKEPGILEFGDEGTRVKRAYNSLRIPNSVAERVRKRICTSE